MLLINVPFDLFIFFVSFSDLGWSSSCNTSI